MFAGRSLYEEGPSQSSDSTCFGLVLYGAFWMEVRIQPQPFTILGDTYPPKKTKKTVILRF